MAVQRFGGASLAGHAEAGLAAFSSRGNKTCGDRGGSRSFSHREKVARSAG
ncbi:hypothetical protein XCR_2667 [Xanthomonas campestris pv. raphani 756C]|nr:hypothetical protein XCR_2667 [Xanthomonas campestris pv. raphani 756C]